MEPEVEVADAEHALGQVGVDPRAALAEADAVVARVPHPRTRDEVREVATAHRAAGLALRQLSRLADAESRLQRAVRVADRGRAGDVAAEARMTLAFVLVERGRLRAARTALDASDGALDGIAAARADVVHALVQQRSGQTTESLRSYDAALPRIESHGDTLWEARLRNNRAPLLATLGRTAAAMDDLRRARECYLELGQTTVATDVLWNMGYILGMGGDVPAALRIFDEADSEWGDLDRPERWAGRADLLLRAGLVSEAIDNARLCVDFLVDKGWATLEAETRLMLVLGLLARPRPDVEQAHREGASAAETIRSQGRPDWEALAGYAIAKADLLRTPGPGSVDRAVRASAALRAVSWSEYAADLDVVAGRAAAELGDDGRLRASLSALAASRRSNRFDIRSRAWFARALLAHADGDRHRAARALRSAWSIIETQRLMLGSTDLRAGAATHSVAVVETGLGWAVASGSASRTFRWAELGRAAVLRHPPVAPPEDDVLAMALTRLRWAVEAEERQRIDGAYSAHASTTRRRCETDVVGRARHRPGGGPRLNPVTLREVADAIGDEAFVHYLVSRERLGAVVVTATSSTLHDLGPMPEVERVLDTMAFGLRRSLMGFGTVHGLGSSADAVRRASDDLDARLLGALRSPVGDRPVVVCPSGRLTEVPWSLLPAARGRTVKVAPSATVWLRSARTAGASTSPPRVVAVAGPGLPGAEREAREVARLHPGGRSFVGSDATVGRVLEAALEATVLHLAAHGDLRTDNPMFSSLRMVDGPLTCYDLERLHTAPSTVVMSACSSGSGRAEVADETLGLGSTLLALGATSVIAPLFAVPDDETRPLMVDLHGRMAAGLAPAEALAAAQIATDVTDVRATATAAAFVAYGA